MTAEDDAGSGYRRSRRSLRETVADVIALSALGPVWSGYDSARVLADLADVLLRHLRLEIVYVVGSDGSSGMVRLRDEGTPETEARARAAAEAAIAARPAQGVSPWVIDLRGRRLAGAVVRIGGDPGLCLAAASADAEFPSDMDRLLLTLAANQAAQILGRRRLEELHQENELVRREVDELRLLGSVVAVSRAMRRVLADVDSVAPTDATVLVTGETGTGKELIAREIHRRSRRAQGPFIAVHPAAIPSTLIASELFGHERGAFTGALQRRLGRFEIASRGTLFLDEVGELPPETQVMLLRVLQERQFQRIGGNELVRTQARLVAATHRDLPKMVAEETFREDLYYRLNVFPIHVPPLRERREDIVPLAEHFCAQFADRLDRKIRRIAPATMERLTRYAWPGNVRELENVIERAVILARGPELVVPASFFPEDRGTASGVLETRANEMEKRAIEEALKASRGQVGGHGGAAARLGLRPTTLFSKLKKHGIHPARFKER